MTDFGQAGHSIMSIQEINRLAAERVPDISVRVEEDFHRHDVIRSLEGRNNIGIELGVAGGVFSRRMVESGKFKAFYGVDLYADHHDTAEYVHALKHVGIAENYKLLRMSFDDALALFDDDYFDFVYFDGYAHTGEEGGKSFVDWFQKVKVGGVVAGDDYDDDWPLVKWAVNSFANELGVQLHVTGRTETTNQSRYPSWFFTKERVFDFKRPLSEELLSLGRRAKEERRRLPSPPPVQRSQITLSPEQILQICDKLCAQDPSKAREIMAIAKRHAKALRRSA